MDMGKVAYLVFLEKPWSNLLQRQVIDVLKNIQKESDMDILLVSFLPLYQYIIYYQNIKDLDEQFDEENIELQVVPLPFPIPVYTRSNGWDTLWKYNWVRMPLVIFFSLPVLFYIRFRKDTKIFHCRSYPVAVPTMVFKKFADCGFIFDPRSDFPEENITNGNWGEESISYRMWKYFEAEICDTADRVITISETFEEHYRDICDSTNTERIPNNVDIDSFKPNIGSASSFREKHNIPDSTTLVCYSGSMVKNSWNNPREYACVMEKMLSTDIDVRFLFLIPEKYNETLIDGLTAEGIRQESYIIENPAYEDVPKFLSYADIGIYILDRPSIRIGTKFVEYCAVGLPTIVNENILGAARLIQDNNLGVVIPLDFDTQGSYCPDEPLPDTYIEDIKEMIHNQNSYSRNCSSFAEENFATSEVARKYAKIYQELSGWYYNSA